MPLAALTFQRFNLTSDSQCQRCISFNLPSKPIRHVSKKQHPKSKRQPEKWKLESKRQGIDNCHERNPDCPCGEQCRNDFVAVMFPCEKIANGLERDAIVFPFVGQHTKRRCEKGIVTKLIDANFRRNYRQCCDVSKPGCFASIQEIDKRSVESPSGYGKEQITKISTTGASSLEEKNQEQLRNKRPPPLRMRRSQTGSHGCALARPAAKAARTLCGLCKKPQATSTSAPESFTIAKRARA